MFSILESQVVISTEQNQYHEHSIEEYVSLLIGLYKNNGSVSHVAIRFLII